MYLENDKHLQDFLKAVERGKQLHPGPFTFWNWKKALWDEFCESKAEDCHACEECTLGSTKAIGCITTREGTENLKRYYRKVINIAVVAYWFAEFLNKLIEVKRGKLTRCELIPEIVKKLAMEHDPR